jgi:hypothetical protein
MVNGLSAAAFAPSAPVPYEPHPDRKPIWAPIALNKSNDRLDLRLPKPSPDDYDTFEAHRQHRKFCNEHQLSNRCTRTNCPYDHEDISLGEFMVLRHKARDLPCSRGPECRRHDCYHGHLCPNVSRRQVCGRRNCSFNRRMHEITDLDVFETINPPENGEAGDASASVN